MATGTTTASSPVRALIARLLRGLDKLDWLAFLIVRLAVGYMFVTGGWGKLHDLKGLGDWFGTLGIPLPHFNALFVATIECVGGLCLIFGLGTRLFAFLLACTMAVALLTVGTQSDAKTLSDWIFKSESLLILIFIVFMVMGPGQASIDAVIRHKLVFTDVPR